MKALARAFSIIVAALVFQPAHVVLPGNFYTIPGNPFFAGAVTAFGSLLLRRQFRQA